MSSKSLKSKTSTSSTFQEKGIDSNKWYMFTARAGIILCTMFLWVVFYIIFAKSQPANIDSYYYLQFFKGQLQSVFSQGTLLEVIMQYAPALMLIVSFCSGFLMYKILKSFTGFKTALITATIFMIDPIIHFNQRIGLYDKNPLIIFGTLLLIFMLVSKPAKSKIMQTCQFVLLIMSCVLLYYVWEGWLVIITFIALSFLIAGFFRQFLDRDIKFMSNLPLLGFITVSVIGIIFCIIKYNSYFSGIFYIREMWPLVFNLVASFFAYMIIVMSYVTMKIKIGEWEDMLKSEIFWIMLVTGFMGFFVYRFMIFAMIGFYIFYGVISYEQKHTILSRVYPVVLILFFMMSLPMYTGESYTDCNLQQSLNYAHNQGKTCLISDWGKGHMYDYYTWLDVKFKGHPRKDEMLKSFTEYDENCVYMLDHDDRVILDHMFNNQSLVIDNMNETRFLKYDEKNNTVCGYTVYYIAENNTYFG